MVLFLMSGIVVVIIVSPIFAHFIGKYFYMVLENTPLRLSSTILYDNIKLTVSIILSS